MPSPVLLWFLLACFLLLPALAAFIGDEPPDNSVVQAQEEEPRPDPDDTMAVAA